MSGGSSGLTAEQRGAGLQTGAPLSFQNPQISDLWKGCSPIKMILVANNKRTLFAHVTEENKGRSCWLQARLDPVARRYTKHLVSLLYRRTRSLWSAPFRWWQMPWPPPPEMSVHVSVFPLEVLRVTVTTWSRSHGHHWGQGLERADGPSHDCVPHPGHLRCWGVEAPGKTKYKCPPGYRRSRWTSTALPR